MNEHSHFGDIRLTIDIAPVSQQAKSDVKRAFQEQVEKKLTDEYGECGFILSGDVTVEVEWRVSEEARYETDKSPDVDNILKPLLDALDGPCGILIDDNQVQHVSCNWTDSYTGREQLDIRIGYQPDEWLNRSSLYFVQVHSALCVALDGDKPIQAQKKLIEQYSRSLENKAIAKEKGVDYYTAIAEMPLQRVFHKTRLQGFEVITLDAFYNKIPDIGRTIGNL